jgi:type I restriction enzyme R subunit
LLSNRKLFKILDEGGPNPGRAVVISDKPDELISHTRGYGKGLKPKDYLEEFRAFITNNINNIAALKLVCTRPKELTRESLKSLKLELDREGFTEKQLNSAWKELKNEEIAADIISFIRREAIGSALISHEQRIINAVEKLKRNHSFSKMELDWLNRIETYLLHETVLDKAAFDSGAFRNHGGFERINKIFQNKLENVIAELNEYLYDDGGKTA